MQNSSFELSQLQLKVNGKSSIRFHSELIRSVGDIYVYVVVNATFLHNEIVIPETGRSSISLQSVTNHCEKYADRLRLFYDGRNNQL